MSLFTKKQKEQDSPRQVITDTSGLIDGRIVAIAKAGFIPQLVIVPRFVVAELQFLADNGDSHKRERARFGLDVIRELQELRMLEVVVARDDFPKVQEVDDKLIALAKRYEGAMLYTTDYNLNKVAQIEGIHVLNVNELAHALRPPLLPGEKVEVKLTQTGQDKTQGVGYLEDGTMIVVERGASKIGQRVWVECSRMLQTQAGKMMFGVLVPPPGRATYNAVPAKQQTSVTTTTVVTSQEQQKTYHAVPQPATQAARQHSRRPSSNKSVPAPVNETAAPVQGDTPAKPRPIANRRPQNQPHQSQRANPSRQSGQPIRPSQRPQVQQAPADGQTSQAPAKGPRPAQQRNRRPNKLTPEDRLLRALNQ